MLSPNPLYDSLIIRCLTTSVALSGQGVMATLATILGGKPLWDTFHKFSDRPIRGSMTAEVALGFTRVMMVTLDSLPQAAAQSLLVAYLDPADRSTLMFSSIGG